LQKCTRLSVLDLHGNRIAQVSLHTFFVHPSFKAYVPTENKAAFSRLISLIKKCVFTCIMAVYDKKDCENTCKPKKYRFYT